jgi:hypothetical protein
MPRLQMWCFACHTDREIDVRGWHGYCTECGILLDLYDMRKSDRARVKALLAASED